MGMIILGVVAVANLVGVGVLAWLGAQEARRCADTMERLTHRHMSTVGAVMEDARRRQEEYAAALLSTVERLTGVYSEALAAERDSNLKVNRELVKQMLAAVGGQAASTYGRLDVTQRAVPVEQPRSRVGPVDTLRGEDGEPIVPVGME